MITAPRIRVLLVDDEPQVLDGLARVLRQGFDPLTATSGAAGLEILKADPEIAVVMSDMRMPLMDGAAFLAQARLILPDAVRVLLTGQADVESAIAAVNEGSIFRFLKKPCPPDAIRAALTAANEQRRLVLAERELLERTLRGAVQALSETLALAAPTVFGSCTRVKRMASEVASKLGLEMLWPLEIAAMMCHIGVIALPPSLWERRAHRALMSAPDRAMLDRVPVLTEQLLAPIPRLERVVEIIHHALGPSSANDLAANVLRAVLDYEEHESLDPLRAAPDRHRPEVLDALAEVLGLSRGGGAEVAIADLCEGMVLAEDVRTPAGTLVVARGHTITAGLAERLRNFGSEKVRIAA